MNELGPVTPEPIESDGLPDFLRHPMGVVRRRWAWMLVALVLVLGAASAFVVLVEPTYLSKATVLVTSQQISEDLVPRTLHGDPIERINAMVGEILSRESLAAIIEEHGLYADWRDGRVMPWSIQNPYFRIFSTAKRCDDSGR